MVEIATREYSDQGNEMNVYAPTKNAVVLLSTQSIAERIRARLPEILVVGALLGFVTLIFRLILVERFIEPWTAERTLAEILADYREYDGTPGNDDRYLEQFEWITPLGEVPLWLDPAITFALGAIVGIGLVLWIRHLRRHG